MEVSVGISKRHVHLTKETWEKLFGESEMEVRNMLNQPGQFASTQTVNIKWNNNVIEKVRVVGPYRTYNQIEIDKNDSQTLGVNPPKRQSGDLIGSLPITIIGPCGEVNLENGLIEAEPHIHITQTQAELINVKNGEETIIINNEGKELFKCKYKVSKEAYYELHIDTYEKELYNLEKGEVVGVKRCGK